MALHVDVQTIYCGSSNGMHVDVQSLFGRTKVAKQDFLQGQERALHVDVQLACYMSSSGLHVDVQNTLTEWVARGLHVDVCCGAPREGARGGEGGVAHRRA